MTEIDMEKNVSQKNPPRDSAKAVSGLAGDIEKPKFSVDTSGLKNTLVNFVVPIVCLLTCILLGVFYIYPSIKGKKALEAEVAQKQALKDILVAKRTILERLVDFQGVVDEDSALVDRVLVSKEMVPELLNQIDAIAREAGLNITRLSYALAAEDKTQGGYNLVGVSLSTEGNFNQLVLFLSSLENAARLVDVDTFRYSFDEDNNILNVNFALQSPYLYVDAKPVTDEPVTLDISSTAFGSFMDKVKSLKFYEVQSTPTAAVRELLEAKETTTSEKTE